MDGKKSYLLYSAVVVVSRGMERAPIYHEQRSTDSFLSLCPTKHVVHGTTEASRRQSTEYLRPEGRHRSGLCRTSGGRYYM